MGAYLNGFAPAIPSQMTGCMFSGAYAVPLIHAYCKRAYTNTVPGDTYRGAGRPKATYLMEWLMDHVARVIGLGPDEIHRRNFVPADAMPYHTAFGWTYDSGDFVACLGGARATAHWVGSAERSREARARGRLRGISLPSYVEICGYTEEEAAVRPESDDTCTLLIDTQSTGQGHQTAYAQIVADRLGVPFSAIRVLQGDTARISSGRGTSGSRSLPVAGPALAAACGKLVAKAERLARRTLQAGDAVLDFVAGRFVVRCSQCAVGLFELARAARSDETNGSELVGIARHHCTAPPYPNGCHVGEVEVDPETGAVEVVAYHVVDDFGTVVNPLPLEGQIVGGIAPGIGQAPIERPVSERVSTQLPSASLLDYRIPAARDVPLITVRFPGISCATSPLGIKGAGDGGRPWPRRQLSAGTLNLKETDAVSTLIDSAIVDAVRRLALAAGAAIMDVYRSEFTVEDKSDSSPVTEADRRAEAIILEGLAAPRWPPFPVIAEEEVAAGRVPEVGANPFWLVDPLDGTKQFVQRQGEFTVNIALIEDGLPILGVVHAPAIGVTYWASPLGAFCATDGTAPHPIACRPVPARGLIAVASRSHRNRDTDAFLARYDIAEAISSGSSIKFCLVASGKADLYPRTGRTMEWDTAAGHAVVRFAGGSVTDFNGNTLRYGKPGFENPHFVVRGAPASA